MKYQLLTYVRDLAFGILVIVFLCMTTMISTVFATSGIYDLKLENRDFVIRYDSPDTGLKLSNMSTSFLQLAIELQRSSSDGPLDITFPREVLDIVFTGHYISIFGDEVVDEYEIVDLSCEEITMRFHLGAGTEMIIFAGADIPGTHLHPEPQIFQPIMKGKVLGEPFELSPVLDSRVCGYTVDPDSKSIHFDIERATQKEQGTFDFAISHDLLGGNYTVLVDGKAIPHSEEFISASRVYPPTSHDLTRISFNYSTNVRSIDLMGETAIPEYGSAFIPLMMAVTILGITTIALRRMHLLKWIK
ncbi:MAG: hypothetical protein ACREBU_10820 [Nitrososphaera sp.]